MVSATPNSSEGPSQLKPCTMVQGQGARFVSRAGLGAGNRSCSHDSGAEMPGDGRLRPYQEHEVTSWSTPMELSLSAVTAETPTVLRRSASAPAARRARLARPLIHA